MGAARAGARGLRRITRRIQGFQRGARGSRLRIRGLGFPYAARGAALAGRVPLHRPLELQPLRGVPRFQGRQGASERSGTRRGDRDGGGVRCRLHGRHAALRAGSRLPAQRQAPVGMGVRWPAPTGLARRARVRGHHGGGDGRRRHHQSGALPSVHGSAAGWEEPGMAVPLHCLADSRGSGAHRGRGAERHVPATSRGQDGGSVQLVVHVEGSAPAHGVLLAAHGRRPIGSVRPPTPPSPHRW